MSDPITNAMTYEEALAFIHSTCWKGSRPGLSRTIELCERLGRPQDTLRFVHVAGTNGKGSTSAMLASVLHAAGYRVGLYTSPFILRFNERMQIDGQDIPDEELAAITAHVRPFTEAMEDTPTEFELITAIALVYFARHHCDIVVFEVGMGGRLDSTNIIDADTVAASIITGIAMDHTAFLGNTHEKIAAEKAGIIKKDVPVIFGGMHPPVGAGTGSNETSVEIATDNAASTNTQAHIPASTIACARVISGKAAETSAPYIEVDHTRLSHVRTNLFGCDLDFGELRGLHIPLSGLYQPHNAATVLTVLDVLRNRGMTIPEEAVRTGLAAVRWPGRFEILCRDPLVIFDGGHNPEGIDAAVAGIKAYFGDTRVCLLTGVMADKDYTHMVNRMATVVSRAFCVRPANDRALDPGRYAEAFRKAGIPAEGYATVAYGVHAGMTAAAQEKTALFCLGSLYMYGEVRAAVMA